MTEPDARPIRVLVVDDHPAIALAIQAAAEAESGARGAEGGDAGALEPAIRVVGTAGTVRAAREQLARAGESAPDVVLCDVQLQSGLDGFEVIDAARAAGCRAIVLTSFDRSSLMRAAFERGAAGFLHKAAEPEAILAAVRQVAGGGTAFSAASLEAARMAPRPPSSRELGVIRELRRGATSDEIGARLGISARTVESHLRRLFDRYGVVSRTELAVLAISEGWIEAG